MSKKGSKGKGAKGRQNTTPTTQTAPPAVQEEAQPSAAHEEPQVPKFPPYEVLNSTPSSSTEAIEAARNLLNKTIRVTLSDGRIIIGQLLSLDNYQNLVLSNTYQAHIKAVEGCTRQNKNKFQSFHHFTTFRSSNLPI